ncbi:hypothetical protein C6369_000250 [Rhodococcus rhodochrous]|uniref:hypothetical protein n=1 Tax=Rhodococcus rhodochrous TaxID=1829 RepID=UPI000D05BBC8|nr:hypothetical protein [Rhodococcus rhodochrous]AYA23168.1 hypothetical protein C6369_000250 [Rhodococcus rhodochrous]
MSAQVLVYGIAGDKLVFIDPEQARELALLWAGFDTWGQARAALSATRWQEIVERFEGWEQDPPAPEEPFDLSQVPGNADGDWPEWPAQQMLDWMPPELIARYGRSTASVLNGDFLDIDPQHEAALVAALEEMGWSCRRNDALVSSASGFTPDTETEDGGPDHSDSRT